MTLSELQERQVFKLADNPSVVYTKGSPMDANPDYFWCRGNDSKLHLIHEKAEIILRWPV